MIEGMSKADVAHEPVTMAFTIPDDLGDDMKLMSIWQQSLKRFPDMPRHELEAAFRWFVSYTESKLSRMVP